MATGGLVSDEELYSFELFECTVCLEALIKKQPRILSCGHTFCTPCLEKVEKEGGIKCPKCRKVTKLPPGGVKALAINTDLSKMREREQELTARADMRSACQMCKSSKKAEYICTSCPLRLICRGCADLHRTLPVLRAHHIVTITPMKPNKTKKPQLKCGEHDQIEDYFCPVCEVALCVVCLCEPEHEGHGDQVVDYQSGIQAFKSSVNKALDTLKEHQSKMDTCEQIITDETGSIEKMKEKLSIKGKNLQRMQNKVQNQLTVLGQFDKPLKDLKKVATNHNKNLKKQVEECAMKNMDEKDFIIQTKEWRKTTNTLIKVTGDILNKKIITPKALTCNIEIKGDVGPIECQKQSLKEKKDQMHEKSVQKRGVILLSSDEVEEDEDEDEEEEEEEEEETEQESGEESGEETGDESGEELEEEEEEEEEAGRKRKRQRLR